MELSCNQESETLFVVGPSQSGKSSTLNTIAGGQIARIGTGDGRSVTAMAEIFSISSPILNSTLNIVDLPGFFDSRLLLSDDDKKIK